jgi:hypothetical protein
VKAIKSVADTAEANAVLSASLDDSGTEAA